MQGNQPICQSPSHCCESQPSPREINQNNHLLTPKDLIHVAAFNVRTLCQIGQQASLAETLLS
ncbi:hypothetical protein CLF_111968, partial [Clonorchis sinensis]